MKPGQIVKTFKSKSGKEIVLRFPRKDDLEDLLEYINELSREDTFLTFSGEVITRKEEELFLTDVLKDMKVHKQLFLMAYDGNRLAGVCGIEQDKSVRKRALHIGIAGISLRKEYRGDGIGRTMFETLIKIGCKYLLYKLLTLNVYSLNIKAQKLYESVGFKRYGVLPGGIYYKGDYIDKIQMYKVNKKDCL
jgi:RimJ/RimL family protein N-acetyltransferase